jgi:hypothetical protein
MPWHVAEAHMPWLLQTSPSQQSVSTVQLAAASPQAQTPPWHVRRLQQSRSTVQALPRSAQVQTPVSQCRPTQHSVSVAQVVCGPPHATQLSI